MGTTADKLAYLQGAKEAIREAIESLGGTVPDGLPFRQYASRIRNLAINSLDVPEGDVQVTCRISPTGQIRVEGPFAYPLSDTYYLSLEGDELPELGNMRCPKGAIIQITPLSGGGNVYVQGGVEPLGIPDNGRFHDPEQLINGPLRKAGTSQIDNYTQHLLGDIKSHPRQRGWHGPMKSEGVKILIHEAIIASWMRIGKPYKKEERTNQYEKNRF